MPEQPAGWADTGIAESPAALVGAWYPDQAQPQADSWGPPDADALAHAAPAGADSMALGDPLAGDSLAAPGPDAAPGPWAAPGSTAAPGPRAAPGPLAEQAMPDDRAKKPPVWWRAARSLGGSRQHDVDEDWLRSLRGPQSQPPPGGSAPPGHPGGVTRAPPGRAQESPGPLSPVTITWTTRRMNVSVSGRCPCSSRW